MNTQYGSLSGEPRYQFYPQESKVTNIAIYSPLSTEVVEDFMRIHDNIDATYIASLIKGVTDQVEKYCSLATTPRTMQSFWMYPRSIVALPTKPVTSFTNVTKIDSDGTETELVSGTDFTTLGLDIKSIHLKTSCYALRVTYQAGYQTNTCPEAIQDAIIQEISLQYKNRQDSNQPSRTSVNSLSVEARHLLVGGGYYDHNR
jgi:hypothetical protein